MAHLAPGARSAASGTATQTPARGPARVASRRAAQVVLGLAGFLALTAVLYGISVHAVPGNSDGATVVLEGQALRSGDLALHHWYLSLDSFWLVDALFYAVAVLVAGVRSQLLNLIPAVIAACVVLVGMAMARRDRRGAPAVAGASVVLALIGLPTYALAIFYLQGPLHVGTTLWCLLAFLALTRAPSRVGWTVAVVLFAAGALGDLQTLAFGVVPALLAGVVAALRRRDWRAGWPAASAAVASVVLAVVVREVAKVVGTFVVNKSNPVASGRQMATNLGYVVRYGAKMLGVGSAGFGSGGVPSALLLVHVVGAVVLVVGAVVPTVELVRGAVRGRADQSGGAGPDPWRLDDLLVLALYGDLAMYVLLVPVDVPAYSRYLTPAIVFAAILAGRLVARLASRVAEPSWRRAAAVAGAVVLACFAAGTGYVLDAPVGTPPAASLGAFLEAHHLDVGIGGYWSSSIVTVETDGAVTVRPVTAELGGRIESYTRNSSSTWYEGSPFEFLVYNPALDFGDVDAATATATYGPPAHTYAAAGYFVLVWRHRLSVAPGPT